MIIRTTPEEDKRERYNTVWRKRFALFPVTVGANTVVWLEWYEVRGGLRYCDYIEYRFNGVETRYSYLLEN